MNSFGRIFKVSIFGESHGECVGITIDGCPAGLSLSPEDLAVDLERRKGGKQKGQRTPAQLGRKLGAVAIPITGYCLVVLHPKADLLDSLELSCF